jgi:hypothetical protein
MPPGELTRAELELLENEARFDLWVAHVIERARSQGIEVVYDVLFFRADGGGVFNAGDVPPLPPEVEKAAIEELRRDGEPEVDEAEEDLVLIWKTDPRDALARVRRTRFAERWRAPRGATAVRVHLARRGTSRQARPGVRRRTRTAARAPTRLGDDPDEPALTRRCLREEEAA